jgi:hypothetical protein
LWQQFTVNLQHNRHKGYRLSTPAMLEKQAETDCCCPVLQEHFALEDDRPGFVSGLQLACHGHCP